MNSTNTQNLNAQRQKDDAKKSGLKKIILDNITSLSDELITVEKTTDDILQDLSKSIDKIDFQTLAFPDI